MLDVGETVRSRDEAVSELFFAHHRRLVGFARLLVDDLSTAEDVVQDAFACLYRRWPWIRDPSAGVSYLQKAVINGSRSELRRRTTARRAPRDPELQSTPAPEATAVGNDERNELLQRVALLPLRQRQVVVLRYYSDLSEAEIAMTLNISRGAVKQHAKRALATLHEALEPVS